MITVGFCCNDDHGMFAARVEGIDIGGDVRLVGPRIGAKATRMLVGKERVKIGRRWFGCTRWMSGVGNIFWDATGMTPSEAHRLLRYLLETGWCVEEFTHGSMFEHIVRAAR